MDFSKLFDTVKSAVLICEARPDLPICYGNEAASRLLAEGRGNPLCCGSLPTVLHFLDGETEEQLCVLSDSGEVLCCRVALAPLWGPSMVLQLTAKSLELEGQHYLILTLEPEQVTFSEAYGSLLMRALRAAHQAASAHLGIEQLLGVLGEGLVLRGLAIFESDASDDLNCTYEWHAKEAAPRAKRWQEIRRVDFLDTLLELGLSEEQTEHILEGGSLLFAEDRSMYLLPLTRNNVCLGYFLADGLPQRPVQGCLRLLEELADMVTFFIRHREEDGRLHYHLDVLSTVTNHFDGMLCVHDSETGEILFANRLLAETVGLPLEGLRGEKSEVVLGRLVPHFFERESTGGSCELYNPETRHWYLVWYNAIQWMNGRWAMLERILDISERKAHESALERIASIDLMTGAYKREWGFLLMARILEQQCHGEETSLVFLDLDKLKCVNDRFGHGEGDEMIRQTVHIIRSCIRKTDLICRWGGDEFLLVIRASEEDTRQIMKKIEQRMETFNAEGRLPFPLGFSYGVVAVSGREPCLEDLIAEADRKMYREKERRSQETYAE